MKEITRFVLVTMFLSGCTTMNESLKLGATMGALSGAGATYAAQSGSGRGSSGENVALGAGIGMAVGLVTSYIVHKQVDEDRQDILLQQTEIHFGDLPPSPFIMPKFNSKKGGAR
jgi:hypothetical protein